MKRDLLRQMNFLETAEAMHKKFFSLLQTETLPTTQITIQVGMRDI